MSDTDGNPFHQPSEVDPRVPIIAQMAARIYTELIVYHDDKLARRKAIDAAFLLYGELIVRLAENDK